MERFIVKSIIADELRDYQFKIQYGEIYSLYLQKYHSKNMNLKSSMERFIVSSLIWSSNSVFI